MPEIAEAARIVHFLRGHLVGKRIKKASAIDDSSVFGKVGTTGDAFANSLTGKKIVSAGSQGKYFWIVLDSPPHPVMHFGMTGWLHIKGIKTGYTSYYNKMKPGEADVWPPKFWKFQLETEADKHSGVVEVAFTDPRRFGRVRLVDCPGDRIRQFSPLVENGPDPVEDPDRFTEQFVLSVMRKRHVPVKALLLDQAFISGIGNWVGDEVLFQARLHPEQYCDTFSDAQVSKLYKSICHVCRTAVDLLGDSDKFPDSWLFPYRWGKGSKDAVAELPSGEKLAFVTVGGRTSCYAPALQKKSGELPAGVKEEPVPAESEAKTKKSKAKPALAKAEKAVKSGESKPPAFAKGTKVHKSAAAPPGPGKAAKPTSAGPRPQPEHANSDDTSPSAKKRKHVETKTGEGTRALKTAPSAAKRGKTQAASGNKHAAAPAAKVARGRAAKADAPSVETLASANGRRRSARISGIDLD